MNIKNRLTNALSKIIKQEEKGEIRQVTGKLYDGGNGFCLSGALGQFFGVDKEFLKDRGQIGYGDNNYDMTYGDTKFNGKCPLYGNPLRYEESCTYYPETVELLMIHLNDKHHLSFTEAQKVIEGLEL